ncbi:hypothetical protein HanIR_Chr15g0778801 [Helianthus annuus]|nr:hypothetical protein HanIR_Chr15g0778801 [Helianthus annuus]
MPIFCWLIRYLIRHTKVDLTMSLSSSSLVVHLVVSVFGRPVLNFHLLPES